MRLINDLNAETVLLAVVFALLLVEFSAWK